MIEDHGASGDDPPLACPDCGVSPNEGCEHVLALIDLTFGYCCGGYAYDRWDEFVGIIADAFQGFLRAGTHPDWDHPTLHEIWGEMIDEGQSTPERVTLPTGCVTRFIGDVLWEADAVQVGTRLYSPSGGRCVSALRLLYADDPATTCEQAKAILREWLVKEPEKRARKKKR